MPYENNKIDIPHNGKVETLPGDDYNGYHAMALTACMGMWDKYIVGQLPASVSLEAVKNMLAQLPLIK